MKKLLTFTLVLFSLFSFGQTIIDPSLPLTTGRVNAAIQGSVTAFGTNTYTGSLSGVTTYTGLKIDIIFTNANSGSCTFNLNSLGAKTLKKYSNGSLVDFTPGDIGAGQTIRFNYDGTYLIANGFAGGLSNLTGDITSLGSVTTYNNSLSVTKGGTGQTTVATGDLLKGSGTNTWGKLSMGTSLQQIRVNSGGTDLEYYSPTTNPMTAIGDVIVGGTVTSGVAAPSRLAIGTSGFVLTSNGSGLSPSWQAPSSLSGLTTNGVLIATSSTGAGTVSDLTYSSRTLTMGLTSSGTNTFTMGTSGNGIIQSNSTGEMRLGATSTFFWTLYSNNAEAFRVPTTKNFLLGSSTDNARLYVSQAALSSSWIPALRVDPGSHTSMTASTSFNGSFSKVSAATQTWAAGTLASQAFNYWDVPTVAFASSSTATTVYNGYFTAPAAGTNATITNKFALAAEGLSLPVAGNGISIKTGSNATMGTSALTAGSATVSTNRVTANSVIFLTSQSDGGTPGFVRISGRSAGTSFTITSSSGTDTSTIGWIIIEPAP